MHRASTLSLNSVKREADKKKVMEALRDNDYPSGFIHRHSGNRTPRWTEDGKRLPRTSLTLPYIGGLSEAVRRVLKPLDIKVAFRPLCILRHQLVRPKDPVPRDQRAEVVYQIPCLDCPKVYIGQSGRTLKHWLSELVCIKLVWSQEWAVEECLRKIATCRLNTYVSMKITLEWVAEDCKGAGCTLYPGWWWAYW